LPYYMMHPRVMLTVSTDINHILATFYDVDAASIHMADTSLVIRRLSRCRARYDMLRCLRRYFFHEYRYVDAPREEASRQQVTEQESQSRIYCWGGNMAASLREALSSPMPRLFFPLCLYPLFHHHGPSAHFTPSSLKPTSFISPTIP